MKEVTRTVGMASSDAPDRLRWVAVPRAHALRVYQEDRALVRAALKFFGSWHAAVRAAGVTFVDGRSLQVKRGTDR